MGGGGGYSGDGGGSQWQQAKITTEPKEEQYQKTNSDTNTPTDDANGIGGGGVSQAEVIPSDLNLPDKKDLCLVKPFDTLLANPITTALKSTTIGSILHIVSRGDRLDALNDLNETCGFITAKMQLLINCLANDHQFTATIVAINGGEVRVHVRNVLDRV